MEFTGMVVARQLYQLQETDLEIETNERTLSRITAELAGNQALTSARTRLSSERQRLDELQKQQRSAEWELADLTSKVSTIETRLYGGRITNPKELTNLQNEANVLKTHRSQIEDRVLDIMEQIEKAEAAAASLNHEVRELETQWQRQQAELTREREQVKTKLSELGSRRELLIASLDRQTADLYQQLRNQKGTAVARVEQGTCASCRIQVSVAKLQQVRGGSLVQCSNCSRILFLA